MQVIKLHSLIAWFAYADTSFTDQDVGSRVIMRYSEHPRSIYVGAEADDWQTFKITKYGRTGGKQFQIKT